MSKDEIPESIVQIAHELGMNSAVRVPHKNRNIYSLGMVDEYGNALPTGTPIIYEIIGNRVVSVSADNAALMLSKLSKQ